jgi:chaperonin cofactor prefoldin
MMTKHLHPELGQRLRMLEGRINTLQQTLKAETGSNKVYGCGTLHALEQRHDSLQERIRTLNDEGPGFRQNVKAEIIVMADDLHAMIDSMIVPSHVAL